MNMKGSFSEFLLELENIVKAKLLERMKSHPDNIEKVGETLVNILDEMLKEYDHVFEDIAAQLTKQCNKVGRGFEKRLMKDWEKPLSMIEHFIFISMEAGSTLNQEYRATASEKNDVLFDVLSRLHGRACLVSRELLSLLRHGFGDGAHNRWRSLHEIAVVSTFLRKHGNPAAVLYREHEIIESYRAMIEYQKYCNKLGYEPISDEVMRSLSEQKDKMIEKNGKKFSGYYGWASVVLNKNVRNFAQLERETKLDFYRPYYRMASHGIHSGPKSITHFLGIEKSEELIMAGPSNVGFTDPGHGMVLSLNIANSNYLLYTKSPSYIVLVGYLNKQTKMIGEELWKVDEKLRS